jgi:2-polyprenyl-6-methoxyphenol hydroxylase-like FAD-dependent oxidoreductase
VLEALDVLGLAEPLLASVPHTTADAFVWRTPTRSYRLADYRRASARFPYYALVPQGRFLPFVVERADGRNSKVRTLSTVTASELGAHLDICWYEVPRRDTDPALSGLELIAEPGATLAVLGHATSWQLGYTIPAGSFPRLREAGIGGVVATLRRRLPWLGDRLDGLTAANQLTLLPVRITRTDRWSEPGLLLIGDAAHVISPVGGNGLNFAVLDAVEAANRLVGPLLTGPVDPAAVDAATAAVETARRPQVDREQAQQKRVERAAARRLRTGDPRPPVALRLLVSLPGVAQLLARRATGALTAPPLDPRILRGELPHGR